MRIFNSNWREKKLPDLPIFSEFTKTKLSLGEWSLKKIPYNSVIRYYCAVEKTTKYGLRIANLDYDCELEMHEDVIDSFHLLTKRGVETFIAFDREIDVQYFWLLFGSDDGLYAKAEVVKEFPDFQTALVWYADFLKDGDTYLKTL